MFLIDLIGSILGFGISFILVILKLIAIAIIAGIAVFKGYNPWLFAIIAFIMPWYLTFLGIFLMGILPRKVQKFPHSIRHNPAFEGKNSIIASIMALSAMIAKADGSVSREEVRYIREFIIKTFGISANELNNYADCFEYGKNHSEEYTIFTNMITQYFRTRGDIIFALAFMFIGIAFQEGGDSSAKEIQTKKIILALGISEYHYQQFRAAYIAQSQGYSYQQYSYENYGYQTESQEDLIKKYSEVLGVSENATMSEIKKAYRKLVKEYHPDKLAADSVPPEYIEFANQKMIEINEAYEYLEKVKGNH